MKELREIENELHMKQQRVGYLELFNSIPTKVDIENGGASI